MKKNFLFFLMFIIITGSTSCKKTFDVISSETVSSYVPLEVGKYIMYQLDSTVYTNLGASKEIHSYVIKDTIQSITTDNIGRKVFSIIRLMRNNADTNNWTHVDAYQAIADSTSLEWIESNKRFIKMKAPIKNGFSWKGNTYINTISAADATYLHDWTYTYENVNSPIKVNNLLIPSAISVLQRNDTIGDPSNKKVYSEINYSKEIYAKNTGLIFKEFLHQVWQPGNANNASGYFEENSYGIKFSILRHNFSIR
jgi:hypothetical protein